MKKRETFPRKYYSPHANIEIAIYNGKTEIAIRIIAV